MADVVVAGEVVGLHKTGSGFRVRETWEVRGEVRSRYWSVFPRQGEPSVAEGDVVRVEGRLATKVSERDARYVDHTVSDASVRPQEPRGAVNVSNVGSGTGFDQNGPQAGAQPNASSDPWTAAPIPQGDVWAAPAVDDGVPF